MEARLTVMQGTLSRNEPVVATLLVRNTSDSSTFLDLGPLGRQYVNVNAVDPFGGSRYVTAEDAKTCFAECLHGPIVRELAAGQEVAASIVLSRWSRFTAPGKYRVYVDVQRGAFVDPFEVWAERIEMPDGVTPGLHIASEDQAWLAEPALRSNTVTINVGARDEERLRTVAETLQDGAEERDYAAALALAWMVDPVAVPSLANLLRLGQGYSNEVLAAVARTGTSEALDVLLQLGGADLIGGGEVRRRLRDIAQDPTADPAARQRATVRYREFED